FGLRARAGSFAFVIDSSGSMASRDALGLAKRELLASLRQLPPEAKFAVLFYNQKPTLLTGLVAATATNKARLEEDLAAIRADGVTDHMAALQAALALRPEVIFFLTDAELMSREDVEAILARTGETTILAVEFGVGPDLGLSAPLRRLAARTGGAYRYVDVTRYRPRAVEEAR
ncbi:MAG: VWA domain-containing protein, partial [Isosphaeraceae bacterium]|nr:VWA domain-containing protein [Isosphaeraceae bacterium]